MSISLVEKFDDLQSVKGCLYERRARVLDPATKAAADRAIERGAPRQKILDLLEASGVVISISSLRQHAISKCSCAR